MSGQILISSNSHLHHHIHKCFFCKKSRWEDNRICKREVDHDYPCYLCIQHFRDELGMIDTLVDEIVSTGQALHMRQRREDVGVVDPTADSLLTREEAYRFQHEWTMQEEPTVLYDQYGNAHRVRQKDKERSW